MARNNDLLVSIDNDAIQKALNHFNIDLQDDSIQTEKNPFLKGVHDELGGSSQGEPDNQIVAFADLFKGQSLSQVMDTFAKAQDIIKGFGDLHGMITEKSKLLQKAIDSNTTLQKAVTNLTEQNEALAKTNERLEARMKEWENTPLHKGKSKTNRIIEKSFNPEDESTIGGKKSGAKKLSLKANKKEIRNLLEAKAETDKIEKGQHNEFYMNGLLSFESSGLLPKDVIVKLQQESNVFIVD